MPGSGKSTCRAATGAPPELPFFDSDHAIEQRIGCSIRDSSTAEARNAFRDIEERRHRPDAMQADRRCLATGGGAVLRAANRERALHERQPSSTCAPPPKSVPAPAARHAPAAAAGGRPAGASCAQLYAERDPLYRETAHFVIETGRPSVPTLVNMVLMQLELAGRAAAPRALNSGHAAPSSTRRSSVPIDLGERSYDILIGSGLLARRRSVGRPAAAAAALIVTNATVAPLMPQRCAPRSRRRSQLRPRRRAARRRRRTRTGRR